MRLTEQELEGFGKFMGASGKCSQIISSQSIVVTDTKKFWKFIIIIRDGEALSVVSLTARLRNSKNILMYEPIVKPGCSHLFVTPAKLGLNLQSPTCQ